MCILVLLWITLDRKHMKCNGDVQIVHDWDSDCFSRVQNGHCGWRSLSSNHKARCSCDPWIYQTRYCVPHISPLLILPQPPSSIQVSYVIYRPLDLSQSTWHSHHSWQRLAVTSVSSSFLPCSLRSSSSLCFQLSQRYQLILFPPLLPHHWYWSYCTQRGPQGCPHPKIWGSHCPTLWQERGLLYHHSC